ncbi:MAG: PspC domain-containing protein [Bacteroidales bacterium]|nr:PspC domain-containing protein [Bacteroidales bacterium]
MKKTLTINLSGTVFNIDDDAYAKLKSYIEALEHKFRQEPDVQELINDIEARIAELFNERLGAKRQVVTLADIDFIIGTLGSPDVISDDEGDNYARSEGKTYRRMYRDPDNRVIGGVCSGLAAYWNIDPVILRVIFIILVFAGFSGVLIYIILWIVMPEAHTTAQKLEMRGEQATVENIKNYVKEEFERVKKNIKDKL